MFLPSNKFTIKKVQFIYWSCAELTKCASLTSLSEIFWKLIDPLQVIIYIKMSVWLFRTAINTFVFDLVRQTSCFQAYLDSSMIGLSEHLPRVFTLQRISIYLKPIILRSLLVQTTDRTCDSFGQLYQGNHKDLRLNEYQTKTAHSTVGRSNVDHESVDG